MPSSTNTTLNSGRMLINLKPLGQRETDATGVIRRLQTKLAEVEGIALYIAGDDALAAEIG